MENTKVDVRYTTKKNEKLISKALILWDGEYDYTTDKSVVFKFVRTFDADGFAKAVNEIDRGIAEVVS